MKAEIALFDQYDKELNYKNYRRQKITLPFYLGEKFIITFPKVHSETFIVSIMRIFDDKNNVIITDRSLCLRVTPLTIITYTLSSTTG